MDKIHLWFHILIVSADMEEIYMSNYRLDVTGDLGLMDYSNIYDYMGVVDIKDNFVLRLNDVNEQNFSMIYTMLKESNFDIYYENMAPGQWEIKAVRR